MSTWEEQVEALRQGVGMWEREGWHVRRWTGEKRVSFLHKYCTQEVRREPGQGAYGCVLTVKGGTKADLWVLLREDDLLAVCAPDAEEGLYKHLRRYALFDKIAMHKQASVVFSVWGPRAADSLQAVVPGDLPANSLDHLTLDSGLVVVRNDWVVEPGYDLIVAADQRDEVRTRLLAAGALPVEGEAVDTLRLEAGVPLYGPDMGEKTIPVEVGLEARAISYDKGCYIGQEVIVRIKHRGKVNRRLRVLSFAEPPPPLPAPLHVGEKEVSLLTSASRSSRGGWVGLAVVHRKYEAGTTLDLGGQAATLHEAPL
jgi:folate-binding protein YgfZ